MNLFEVGDKVRLSSVGKLLHRHSPGSPHNEVGSIVYVINADFLWPLRVVWPNGMTDVYRLDSLELVL